MKNTSPSLYALRLALVMSAFAAAFAVFAIPRLKAESSNAANAQVDRSMDRSRPPTLLSPKDEPRFQAARECLTHERSRTIAECMDRALK